MVENFGEDMHYLSMISDRPDMVFQLEHMMRTVKRHAGGREVAFSVVVNGNSGVPAVGKPELTRRGFHNSYIETHADVYDCPQHWTLHVPCRWFIEPKMERCVFIDTDIIACNDLAPLYALAPDAVCGVPALRNPLTAGEWGQIGMTADDVKYYFNFGMVVVPGKHMKEIGTKLMEKVPAFRRQFKKAEYYAGQIALSHTLKELGVNRLALPREFNWLDSHPEPASFNDVLFMHYTLRREQVPTKEASCSAKGDGYARLIAESARHFYGRKMFA